MFGMTQLLNLKWSEFQSCDMILFNVYIKAMGLSIGFITFVFLQKQFLGGVKRSSIDQPQKNVVHFYRGTRD